jgi:hypothetical protein
MQIGFPEPGVESLRISNPNSRLAPAWRRRRAGQTAGYAVRYLRAGMAGFCGCCLNVVVMYGRHTDTRLNFGFRQPHDDRRQRLARRKLIVDEAAELSLLIGDIYDASLDRALWPDAVNRIRTFLRACTASLVSQDAVTKAVDVHFMLGPEQKFLDQYNEKYFKINPIFPTVMFLEIEQKNVVTDVLPTTDLIQTRFAKEWIKPQGLCDFLFSTLEKSSRGCTVFMMMRHKDQGFFDEQAHRRFSMLLPHIRRALLIGKVIETHQVKAAALADSLDSLASAMFIVDGTGRIVHANASGNLMVSEADVLRAPGGRLHAIDAVADQALLDIFTAAQDGDAALGRKGVAVPITARDDERYVAHVLPMTSAGRRKAGVSYGASRRCSFGKLRSTCPRRRSSLPSSFI